MPEKETKRRAARDKRPHRSIGRLKAPTGAITIKPGRISGPDAITPITNRRTDTGTNQQTGIPGDRGMTCKRTSSANGRITRCAESWRGMRSRMPCAIRGIVQRTASACGDLTS